MNYRERRELKRREREAARKRQAELAKHRRQLEEAEKRRQEEEERRKAWEATDHGRAQLAFDAGEGFFQVQRVISVTKAEVLVMMGASAISEDVDKSSHSAAGFMSELVNASANIIENLPITQTLAVIEEMGWQLVHVGYTYRETYSESRDKFLASGQQIATAGEIVAIYLFRRSISEQDTD